MSKRPEGRRDPDAAIVYEIRVEGQLAPYWAAWYGDIHLVPEGGTVTRIVGSMVDQAALHGLLRKIRDMGLVLLSVRAVELEADDDEKRDKGD